MSLAWSISEPKCCVRKCVTLKGTAKRLQPVPRSRSDKDCARAFVDHWGTFCAAYDEAINSQLSSLVTQINSLVAADRSVVSVISLLTSVADSACREYFERALKENVGGVIVLSRRDMVSIEKCSSTIVSSLMQIALRSESDDESSDNQCDRSNMINIRDLSVLQDWSRANSRYHELTYTLLVEITDDTTYATFQQLVRAIAVVRSGCPKTTTFCLLVVGLPSIDYLKASLAMEIQLLIRVLQLPMVDISKLQRDVGIILIKELPALVTPSPEIFDVKSAKSAVALKGVSLLIMRFFFSRPSATYCCDSSASSRSLM